MALACSASGSGNSGFPNAGGASGSGGSAAAGGSAASTSGSAGSSGSAGGIGINTDAGGDASRKGCTAVDMLFVIDNSTSMRNNQEELAKAFPTFVDAMITNLPPGTDLHVGITTSSFDTRGGGSPGETNCRSNGTVQEFLQHYQTPDQLNNGENGGQGRLFSYQGKSFFAGNTADDPVPLKNWFTSAAKAVGESGSVFEMVAAGGAYIAHPSNGATNKGFIRDEGAVLVVFFLSDEVDNSPETVQVYHDMITSLKARCGGDPCILTGGILMPCLATTPDNTLYGLMSSFGETPKIADIDDPTQYSQAIGDALAQVIAVTCDKIPPPPR